MAPTNPDHYESEKGNSPALVIGANYDRGVASTGRLRVNFALEYAWQVLPSGRGYYLTSLRWVGQVMCVLVWG